MLVDRYSRRFTYLRLSVTEACNFRCNYCLPDGTDCSADSRQRELSLREIQRLVQAFAQMGTRKVRITGGEPSLRKDLCDIIHTCKSTPGIESVALTTNGYRLPKDVENWHAAGLDALNVSLDSLEPARFHLITGHDKLKTVLSGIERALQIGIKRVKINTVLMRGFNDSAIRDFLSFVRNRPLTLRFIELMQTGDNTRFFNRHHLDGSSIIELLLNEGWQEECREAHAGPAREFYHADYLGGIGLIMPYSNDFCASCNRLRVSSDGKLFNCLFTNRHQDLRHLIEDDDLSAVTRCLRETVLGKHAQHNLQNADPGATRHLAMIGG